MTTPMFRRAALALACGCATLLGACGSSTVDSALSPTRFLSVGDGFSDIGQGPNGTRPTVNDGTNGWTQEMAAHYGKTLTAANAGGLSWAQGYARVTAVDVTGHSAPSITTQITTMLAANTLGNSDVVLVSGGISDVVAEVDAAGGVNDAVIANVKAAGTELGTQIRRLVTAGAPYIVVSGMYNVGNTPWARAKGDTVAGQISSLSTNFNDALLVSIVDLSQHVLFVDPALLFNLMYNEPSSFAIDNKTTPVCTTPDAYTCNTSTLIAGADYAKYMFADSLNVTPALNRWYGSSTYSQSATYRLTQRW